MICEHCGKEIESYIGVSEFARRVGLSPTTIKRHIENGSVKAFEYQGSDGGSYFKRKVIPQSEIESFKRKFLVPVSK